MTPAPYSPPQSVNETSGRFNLIKAVLVLFLTAIITAGSILMIGPQILFIVPVALFTGVIFAVLRSFWSTVFFGYPLTFGLLYAWIGSQEVSGYEQTTMFAISVGIGLIGCALIASGLWMALPSGKAKQGESFMET